MSIGRSYRNDKEAGVATGHTGSERVGGSEVREVDDQILSDSVRTPAVMGI